MSDRQEGHKNIEIVFKMFRNHNVEGTTEEWLPRGGEIGFERQRWQCHDSFIATASRTL